MQPWMYSPAQLQPPQNFNHKAAALNQVLAGRQIFEQSFFRIHVNWAMILPFRERGLVKHVDHNTHWIIACRHVGHDNDFDVIVKKPSKIGYLVCTFPKSKYSIQHVDRFMNYLNESWIKRNDPKPDQNKRFSF
jgi:hypothetical protein